MLWISFWIQKLIHNVSFWIQKLMFNVSFWTKKFWIQKLLLWISFWTQKLTKNISFWIQKLTFFVSFFSGSRNWHYGSVSGSRNWHYGRGELYAWGEDIFQPALSYIEIFCSVTCFLFHLWGSFQQQPCLWQGQNWWWWGDTFVQCWARCKEE